MGNPGVGDAEGIRRRETIEKYLRRGHPPPGQTPGKHTKGAVAMAMAELKISLHNWITNASGTVYEPDWSLWKAPERAQIEEEENSPVERREVRDAAFWRKKAVDLQKQLADAEHIAEQLAGIRHQSIVVPPWLISRGKGKPGKAVLGILLSDIHAGEVVSAEELGGLNEYNVDICRRRLRRMFTAACEIGPRWLSDCDCQGVLLALGGDLVSGSIHDEIRISNELTAHEQVRFIVEEVSAGINLLVERFGRVHVASVPGNHGRTTPKDTAKLFSRLNYDTMAADMVADRFHGNDRVTFQIGSSSDQIIPVFGWSIHLCHGQKTGTGGGFGFAGADLPIVRGGKKIAAQQASVGRRIHLQLRGHLHYSTNPGRILSNGSVPGYTEFSADMRSEVEPPKQWLFVITEKWCLRERVDVQLEDPPSPDKPRVRVYV